MVISSLLAAKTADMAPDLIGKAAEKLFDATGKKVLEGIKARVRAYTGKVPKNHELEQAIRLAELTASLVLVETFRGREEADTFDTRAARLPSFTTDARTWLLRQTGLVPGLETVPDDVLVAQLDDALDAAISSRSSAEAKTTLAGAENEVWRALVAGVGEPPAAFQPLFLGQVDGEPGWSVLFVAFLREALGEDPSTETAFITTRLARVHQKMGKIDTKLYAIQDDTAAIRAAVYELTRDLALTKAEKEALAVNLDRVKTEYGNTISLLSGFLQTIVGSNVPVDQFAATLFKVAADWKAAGERLDALGASRNLTPQIAGLRDRAKAAYADERITDFEAILAEIELQEATALATLETQARSVASEIGLRRKGLIETKQAKLALARSLLRYDEGASLIAEIIDLSTAAENESLGALWVEEERFLEAGCIHGLNASLEVAVALSRIGVKRSIATRDHWAWLGTLGTALATLGARESSSTRLQEAVMAHRSALSERTRERDPLDWALTTMTLPTRSQSWASARAGRCNWRERSRYIVRHFKRGRGNSCRSIGQ